MADSKTEAGKVQDKPGTSCTRKQRHTHSMSQHAHSMTQKPALRAPTHQFWGYWSIKLIIITADDNPVNKVGFQEPIWIERGREGAMIKLILILECQLIAAEGMIELENLAILWLITNSAKKCQWMLTLVSESLKRLLQSFKILTDYQGEKTTFQWRNLPVTNSTLTSSITGQVEIMYRPPGLNDEEAELPPRFPSQRSLTWI